jgi:uncharacterized protein
MNDSAFLPDGVVRLVREDLHLFSKLGRDFAVYKPSGDFFALDEVGKFAIDRIRSVSTHQALADLKAKMNPEQVEELITDLNSLMDLQADSAVSADDDSEAAEVEMTDLTLNVVNHCNLACVYCWNERGTYAGDTKSQLMTPEIARKGVDLLLAFSKGADSLVVDFYGGEPLLNLPVMKATVDYCQKISQERNIRFSFLLATNGLLLTPETAAWLHEAGVNVALSIDGNKTVQDAQRPFPGGKGSFDKVWSNLEALPDEIRKEYVARATITPSGPGAFETYKMLCDLGFTRIEVFESEAACFGLPMQQADRFYLREEDRQRLMDQYCELLDYQVERVANGEVEYRDLFFTRVFKQMARLVRNGDFEGPCAAGLGQIAVDLEGFVYPCTAFIGHPEWRMGHVDDSVDKKVQKKLIDCDIMCSKDCGDCWARNLCLGSGSCFNLNHFNHGDIGKPVKEHCDLYRFKIELLIAALDALQLRNPERFEALFAPGHFEDRTAWSPDLEE